MLGHCRWYDYEHGIKDTPEGATDDDECKVPTERMFGALTIELNEVLNTPGVFEPALVLKIGEQHPFVVLALDGEYEVGLIISDGEKSTLNFGEI